jgi:hypothetical protein
VLRRGGGEALFYMPLLKTVFMDMCLLTKAKIISDFASISQELKWLPHPLIS